MLSQVNVFDFLLVNLGIFDAQLFPFRHAFFTISSSSKNKCMPLILIDGQFVFTLRDSTIIGRIVLNFPCFCHTNTKLFRFWD